jgi:hypothetical protein
VLHGVRQADGFDTIDLAATSLQSFDLEGLGRGVIGNKHSFDVESPPSPRVCMSVQTEGKSCSDPGPMLDLNVPPFR